MFYKICGSCGRKIKIDEVCSCRKARDKAYDRERRDKDKAAFYHSKAWRQLTKQCKLRDNGLDLFQLKINNRIIKGELSHHIEELGDAPDLKLDINNLIFVSSSTHNLIHKIYNKSEKDKKELQRVLKGLVGG